MGFVDLCECSIDGIALSDFIVTLLGVEDDTDGQDVKHLLERDMFALHFLPDAIWTLDARLEFVVNATRIKRSTDGRSEIIDSIVTL